MLNSSCLRRPLRRSDPLERAELFFDNLSSRANTISDRAVLILAFEKQFGEVARLTPKQIADRFERSHVARPNVTRLAQQLARDARASSRGGEAKALKAADNFLRETFPELYEVAEQPSPADLITRDMLASAPFIDAAYLGDLDDQVRLYRAIHVQENSMRRLISAVLGRRLGSDWWDTAASQPMKKKHEDRLAKEAARRWLPARSGLGPLYSIDWSDLITLVRKYEDDFRPYLRDWIAQISPRLRSFDDGSTDQND